MNPAWTRNRMELYSFPGFIDDNFREGWSKFTDPAPIDETLANIDDIAGDYAIHTAQVADPWESWYHKDISALGLSSTTFPKARVRYKANQTETYIQIQVQHTDDVNDFSDWILCDQSWQTYELDLTAGKTVKWLIIGIKRFISSTFSVYWDYFIIEKETPFIPTDITVDEEEHQVLLKEHTVNLQVLPLGVPSCDFILHYNSDITYPDVGAILFLYAADSHETYDDPAQKLFRGRIKRKWMAKTGEIAGIHYSAEDFLGDIIDEDYTGEYAVAEQVDVIVDDLIDTCMGYDSMVFFKATRDSINATSNSIIANYEKYKAFDLLKKLTELSQWTGGAVKGGCCFLDVGGDLHFEKLGEWTAPIDIVDEDIRKIETVDRDLEGIVNDYTLVIREEEAFPGDSNQWDEEADSNWTVTIGAVSQETADIKSGEACMKFEWAGITGETDVGMRKTGITVDRNNVSRLKFWMKRVATITTLSIRLITGTWAAWSDYWYLSGLDIPASGVWTELDIPIADITGKVLNPGNEIKSFELHIQALPYLGTGYVLLDKIRFIRDELSANATDPTSQGLYGIRKASMVDKSYTNTVEAGYWAENYVASRKDPITHVQVIVRGRANTGFRPPQTVDLTITDVSPSIDEQPYQIIKATHKQTPGVYTCSLELHEADRLPIPVPSLVSFIRNVTELQRIVEQGMKDVSWKK